jgi:hypothetical protein
MSSLSVRTLSGLPEYNNAIVVQSGHKLIIPGTPTNIVQAVKTDSETISPAAATGAPTTSNTYGVTNLSLTITPASASSRFLLMTDLHYSAPGSTPGWVFFRGTSPIGIGDAASNRRRSTAGTGLQVDLNQISGQGHMTFIDSPATTTAITYSVRFWSDNTNIIYINRSQNDSDSSTGIRTISTLTIMELL